MGDDIIYVAFDNPAVGVEPGASMLACRRCRNKTYRLECEEDHGREIAVAAVYCAACGQCIGKMGWLPEEIPEAT